MDIRGVEPSPTLNGRADIALAPSLGVVFGHAKQAAAEDAKVGQETMTHIMQDQLDSMNISLKYFTYGDSGQRIAIAVVNTNTGEVVREIPSKELRVLYAKMNELVGMILNKQI